MNDEDQDQEQIESWITYKETEESKWKPYFQSPM